MSWALEIEIVLAILVQSDFSWTWNGSIGIYILCSFRANVECANVVLDSELDSKSNSEISNWIGSPPWSARLLGSPSRPWCPVCPTHHLHDS
jgi:hypothetical protein